MAKATDAPPPLEPRGDASAGGTAGGSSDWRGSALREVYVGLSPEQSRQARAATQEALRTASSQETSPEILKAMAANPDVAVREALAGNLHTPADALAKLAKDEDVAVRRAVAANTMAWKNTLLALTRDEEPSVLKAVAGNDSAPPSALRKLANYTGTAEEPNESVKRAVARNHGTPQDVLAALAANEQPMSVRIEVASNENAGAKLLTTLCSDPSPQIRAEVADNVASPPEVLARLLSDPSPAVQAAAFKTSRLVDLGQAAERESDPLKASALREAALKLKDSDFIATLERRSGRSLVDNSGILMSIGLLGVVALDSAAAILRRTQGDRYSLPTLGVEQN